MPTATELMDKLDKEGQIDYDLTNGVIRSSKEIVKHTDGSYGVFHAIDGSYGLFSRECLMEVFEGKRDIWDADIEFKKDGGLKCHRIMF